MLRPIVGLFLLTVATAFGATPAAAQMFCGERTEIVRYLEKNHAETLNAAGIVANGQLLEVFASPRGTWTIVVTNPNGTTCVIAAGDAWEQVPVQAAGPAA